jgi:hypothetical protein
MFGDELRLINFGDKLKKKDLVMKGPIFMSTVLKDVRFSVSNIAYIK